MYEKYSDSEINREINTEKVFNWIFYTVVKSHFYNNNNSNIGLNEVLKQINRMKSTEKSAKA